MLWSKVFVFADPFQYQSAFRTVDVKLFPTTRGRFCAELTQINMKKLWVQSARESLPRVYVGTVKSNRAAIGFLTHPNQPAMHHCGKEVLPGEIIVNDSDTMHRQTGADCNWGSMSLTREDFSAASEAITGHKFSVPGETYLVRPEPAIMSRLIQHVEVVTAMAATVPDLLESPEVTHALEQEMTYLMVRCVTEGEVPRMRVTARRRQIVNRLEEYLAANASAAVYLGELCAAIGVAERTLRAACDEHLGMGPARYLHLRRMHLVNRALVQHDPGKMTVTRVAMDYGFWELGRFSVMYKALFGESPKETLCRAGGRPNPAGPPGVLTHFDV